MFRHRMSKPLPKGKTFFNRKEAIKFSFSDLDLAEMTLYSACGIFGSFFSAMSPYSHDTRNFSITTYLTLLYQKLSLIIDVKNLNLALRLWVVIEGLGSISVSKYREAVKFSRCKKLKSLPKNLRNGLLPMTFSANSFCVWILKVPNQLLILFLATQLCSRSFEVNLSFEQVV